MVSVCNGSEEQSEFKEVSLNFFFKSLDQTSVTFYN